VASAVLAGASDGLVATAEVVAESSVEVLAVSDVLVADSAVEVGDVAVVVSAASAFAGFSTVSIM
jgi:hypothetical protein